MNYTIKIEQDDFDLNPRVEWDNLSTMVCFHKRYNLGDENHGFNSGNYNSFDDLEKDIIRKEGKAIVLPIYLYDHSGITVSTRPFGCQWDSGQVGFVYVTFEKIKKEFSKKRISKKLKEQVFKTLENEVKTYDDYLTGNCYRYEIHDENDNIVESCGGFLGDEKFCREEAELVLKNLVNQEKVNRQNKLKTYIKNHVPLEVRTF